MTGAAAAGALPVGTAVAASTKNVPRWAMVMDLRACIGCRACTVACKAQYNTPLGAWRSVVRDVEYGEYPNARKIFLPLMCNHCAGNDADGVPPCVKVCPEYPKGRKVYTTPDGEKIRYRYGATYVRPDGMVLVDNDLCIGCGKCIEACPYGVRSFNKHVKAGEDPSRNGIEKCTMCTQQVDNGQVPSCVTTCQGSARTFGDLNDPDSGVSKLAGKHGLLDRRDETTLLPEEGTVPFVFYIDPDGVLAKVYRKGEPYVDQIA